LCFLTSVKVKDALLGLFQVGVEFDPCLGSDKRGDDWIGVVECLQKHVIDCVRSTSHRISKKLEDRGHLFGFVKDEVEEFLWISEVFSVADVVALTKLKQNA